MMKSLLRESMILPNGNYYSLNSKETHINNNVLIVGTSGSQKTRNFVVPNILECSSSYIITDPKGNLYKKYGEYLKKAGYRVEKLSFIHPDKSIHYNPLEYINNTQDIQKLSSSFVNFSESKLQDPFWDNMSLFLINSIFGYLYERKMDKPETYCIPEVMKVLRSCGRSNSDSKESVYSELMKMHYSEHPESWAYKQYQNVNQSPNKTFDTIVSTALSKFSCFDTEELQSMLSFDEVDITSIGKKPTAIFCEISDTDRSMDKLANTFYTQAMNQLITYADEQTDDYKLPVPVKFILDDFATSCKIDGFEKMVSNIRSRDISAVIVVQSFAQLTSGYGSDGTTIIDNCDTMLFYGTNSPETAMNIGLRCNKTIDTILHMPLNHCWIFRRGDRPVDTKVFDLDEYINDNFLLYQRKKNKSEKEQSL